MEPSDEALSLAEPLSLADLPLSFLAQLVREAPSASVLPLFRTCRVFRDLVCASYACHLEIALPASDPVDSLRLLTACRRCKDVQCRFRDSKLWPSPAKTASCRALLESCIEAQGNQPLTSIKRLHVTGLVLDSVLPGWLANACPNLRTLELEFCVLHQPHTGPQPSQRLESLTLRVGTAFMDGMWGDEVDDDEETGGNWPAWQRQLDALRGVTSLSLPVAPWFLMGCPSLRDQLTHLELGLPVDDEGMEVLLNMKQLQSVRCSTFELNQQYRHRACSWTQLHCRDFHIDQFDKLPLSGVTLLQGFRHIIPSADIDTCKRVVAAVNRCGGLSWGYHVSIHNRTARTDTACLAVLLPTLNTCTSVSFSLFDVHITPELLTLLSANLAKCAFKRVSLHECTWGIGVWPMLLPSLPHARLKIETDMLQEEWVKEMCVHATQPVELDIFCRGLGRGARGQAWQDGWSERVQDAMTAAGHQHVKLTTRFTQWF